MNILVTFAVEPEFEAWRTSRSFKGTLQGKVPTYAAEFGGSAVTVILTGMGPANASNAMAAVAAGFDVCICSGFCGSLRDAHGVGDLLVARGVQRLDGSENLRCAPELLVPAEACGAKTVERFLSSDAIVASVADKARLAPVADAVDMESFAVLSVARDRGMGAIAIRAVSDRFDQALPMDFSGTVDSCGHVLKGKLAQSIAEQPWKIPALIRLGKQSKIASENLISFLEKYIERISSRSFAEPDATAASPVVQ